MLLKQNYRKVVPDEYEIVRQFLFDDYVDVRHFGALGNGVTDDSHEIEDAIIQAEDKSVIFTPGNYLLERDVTIPANVATVIKQGATITVGAGITLTINGVLETNLSQSFAGSGAVILSSNVPVIEAAWFPRTSAGVAQAVANTPTGGTLRFAGGTWNLTTPILPTNNTRWILERDAILTDGVGHTGTHIIVISNISHFTLEGEGKIQSSDNGAEVAIHIGASTAQKDLVFKDFTIEDFSIDLGGGSYGGFGWRIWDPAGNIQDIRVQDVQTKDTKYAFHIRADGGGIISNVRFERCSAIHDDLTLIATAGDQLRGGFNVDRTNAGINGVEFIDCFCDGYLLPFGIASSKNISFINPVARGFNGIIDSTGQLGEGLHLEATSTYGDTENILISNIRVEEPSGAGIQFTGGPNDTIKNVSIRGGQIYQSSDDRGGVSMPGADNRIYTDIVIDGLEIFGNRSATDGRSGIYANWVDNLIIRNCYVKNAYRSGIGIERVRHAVVEDNVVVDCNWSAGDYANVNVYWHAEDVLLKGNVSKIVDREGLVNDRTYRIITKAITGATNATPIVVTATGHRYVANSRVMLVDETGNTGANGIWTVANPSGDTFELATSVGSGAATPDGRIVGASTSLINCYRYGGDAPINADFVRPYEMYDLKNDTQDLRISELISTTSATRYPRTQRGTGSALTGLSFLLAQASATVQTGLIYSPSDPEGIVTAAGGTLCVTPASTISPVWLKQGGSGNTGWAPVLNFESVSKNSTGGPVADTLDNTDRLIRCTTGAGGDTITLILPSIADMRKFSLDGMINIIFAVDGGASVTINRAGTDTINGWDANTTAYVNSATSIVLDDAHDFIMLKAIGWNRWLIIENNGGTVS